MTDAGSMTEHSDVLIWLITGGGSVLLTVLGFFAASTLNDLKKANEEQWKAMKETNEKQWTEIMAVQNSLNRLWGQHDARHNNSSCGSGA